MFEKAIIFFVIVLAAVFETSFFPNILPSKSAPKAVLLLIIFWVSQKGYEKNWARAVFSGFILDVFYFWPIGVNIMAVSLAAFGVDSLVKRFSISQKNLGFFVIIAMVAAGTIGNDFFLSCFATFFNYLNPGSIDYLMLDDWNVKIIVMKILANIVLFSIIYWPLLSLEKFLLFHDRKSMQGRFFR